MVEQIYKKMVEKNKIKLRSLIYNYSKLLWLLTIALDLLFES